MIKLLHIHTDIKFIHDVFKYSDEYFYNEIIYVGDSNDNIIAALNKLEISYKILSKTDNSIDYIIKNACLYNSIIINELCSFKFKLVQRINFKGKIFLRLFGYEIYQQILPNFISKKTFDVFSPITLNRFSLKEYFIRKINRILGREYRIDKKKHKAIFKKFNAIILLNEFEYKEIKKYCYLPKLIKLPLYQEYDKNISIQNKENRIIVGNSRIVWNNHLDVIYKIRNSKNYKNYRFQFLFNYGQVNHYTDFVKNFAGKDFQFIEDFMPYNEFIDFYKGAKTLIINSYRQHALANIVTGILSGCKVYLNPKSSTYAWLQHEGFIFGNFDFLDQDLNNNNIALSQQEYLHNLTVYDKLRQNYTVKDFSENILLQIKNG